MLSIGSDENLVNLGNVNDAVLNKLLTTRLTVADGALADFGV